VEIPYNYRNRGNDWAPRKPKWAHWSAADTETLRNLWGWEPIGSIGRILGRSRSSICYRVIRLGLKFVVPEGYESTLAAAKRTGFPLSSFRLIMRWANVPLHLHSGRSRSWSGNYRHQIVDQMDVDEAMEKWFATETVNAAAKRLKVDARRLVSLLKEANVPIRALTDKPRSHLRIPSADAERVVADFRNNMETVRAGAKRHGIGLNTIYAWMRYHNMCRKDRKQLVEKAAIDRIVGIELSRPGCRSPRKLISIARDP
jgi:phage antirepressor YoqD-like protein